MSRFAAAATRHIALATNVLAHVVVECLLSQRVLHAAWENELTDTAARFFAGGSAHPNLQSNIGDMMQLAFR